MSFYRTVATMSASQAASHLVSIVTEESHSEYYKNRGVWKPLSVWEKEGYDGAAIVAKSSSKDIQVHPVLGTLYRVHLLEEGQTGRKGTKTVDHLSAQDAVPKRSIEIGASSSSGPPTLAIMDGDDDTDANAESSSCSSSDSTSSSSSSRKLKKSKKSKGKKDKKDKKTKKRKSKKDKKSKSKKSKKGEKEKSRKRGRSEDEV